MLQNIKKSCRPKVLLLWPVCIALLCICTGCNTRIEGCLDSNAENLDFNAEIDCDGCCTYPSISLSLTQKWGDRNFSNADTLYDIHLQPYKIQDLKYYLTSWSWSDISGNVYTVDSVEAGCNEEVLRFTPDILIADTRQFIFPMGTIRKSPATDSLYFSIGLEEDFNCIDEEDPDTPSGITKQSPLWNPQTSSLETIRLVLQRDLSAEDYDTVFISTNVKNVLGYSSQIVKGLDTQLNLTVNYALWFQDADIEDLSSFNTSLLNHLEGSIFRTP